MPDISKESISVDHSDNQSGMRDLVSAYNVDTGPLAMPEHIRIGQPSSLERNQPITSYADQVDEYAIWLEDQIKAGNTQVMQALDFIYGKAQAGHVVIKTRCCPAPYITHAHQVRRQILELAGHKFDV